MSHHEEDEQVAIVTQNGKAMPDTAPTRNKTIVFFAALSVVFLVGVKYATESYLDESLRGRRTANLSVSQANIDLSLIRYQALDQIGEFTRACEIVDSIVASGIVIPPKAVDPNSEVRSVATDCGVTFAPDPNLSSDERRTRQQTGAQLLTQLRSQREQGNRGAVCGAVTAIAGLHVALDFESLDVAAQVRARADQCAAGQNPPMRAGRTAIADSMNRVVASLANRGSVAVIAPRRSSTSEQGTPWSRLAEAPSWYPEAVEAPAPVAAHE